MKFHGETFLTQCELKKPIRNDDSKQYAVYFSHPFVATGKMLRSCYFEIS